MVFAMEQTQHKTPNLLYAALKNRDAAYDGRLFFGVTSTGIFCRPICPAPKPKPENVVYFTNASDPLDAGFRPCKRCRPEAKQGSPAWGLTRTTVSRALTLIAGGALDTGDTPALAARLGVGERHLTRLFKQHLGRTPGDIALDRRITLAKEMLIHSNHPIADIAFAAGFQSLRRFHSAFKTHVGISPRAFRNTHRKTLHHD